MPRKPLLRVVAAALGGLAVAAVLLAAIVLINAGGFAGSTVATPLGWTIPLIAGLLVGGLSWLLLSDRADRVSDGLEPPRSTACPTCGSPCLVTWRLCPYCGTILHGRDKRG